MQALSKSLNCKTLNSSSLNIFQRWLYLLTLFRALTEISIEKKKHGVHQGVIARPFNFHDFKKSYVVNNFNEVTIYSYKGLIIHSKMWILKQNHWSRLYITCKHTQLNGDLLEKLNPTMRSYRNPPSAGSNWNSPSYSCLSLSLSVEVNS